MRVQLRAAHGTNNVYSRVRNATSLRLVVACGERDCAVDAESLKCILCRRE